MLLFKGHSFRASACSRNISALSCLADDITSAMPFIALVKAADECCSSQADASTQAIAQPLRPWSIIAIRCARMKSTSFCSPRTVNRAKCAWKQLQTVPHGTGPQSQEAIIFFVQVFQPLSSTSGLTKALIIGIGFWDPLYFNHNKEPPK